MSDWLRLYLPIAALFALAFYGYGQYEWRRELRARIASEHSRLHLADERLAEALTDSALDLRVIAGTPALRSFISDGQDGRALLEALFGSFVREDVTYYELRLLDAQGAIQVGARRRPEGPQMIGFRPADASTRATVVEPLKLIGGQVHASTLRLATRDGVPEVPRRPLIELSARVSAASGAPDFVLNAQLRGAILIKQLGYVLTNPDSEAWVLDDAGHWIVHPDPAMSWSAQRRGGQSLQQRVPALAPLLAQSAGEQLVDGRMYVHRRAEPLLNLVHDGLAANTPVFHLITHFEARQPAPMRREELVPLGIALLLLAIGTAVVRRNRSRAERAERRERALIDENARTNQSRSWVREHVYQLSLKIYASRDPADFGRRALGELAPSLSLTAGCVYVLYHGRARPVASFGLADGVTAREFGPGEGLVGEALRTRQERQLRPPPPGYLDLRGGLGDGPAAELRILPLWVHGRTVGALELAFSRLLEAQEEEFLRQVLPLLALNLDGFLASRG